MISNFTVRILYLITVNHLVLIDFMVGLSQNYDLIGLESVQFSLSKLFLPWHSLDKCYFGQAQIIVIMGIFLPTFFIFIFKKIDVLNNIILEDVGASTFEFDFKLE
jgi:hypothetical protein